MKAYTRAEWGWGGVRETLYPMVDCPALLQVNSDCTHRDEVREIYSLVKCPPTLDLLNPFDHNIKMKAYEGLGGGEGGNTLPQGRLSPNIDYVHRDEVGEIVSSILLKGFQKLTRLFSFPLS